MHPMPVVDGGGIPPGVPHIGYGPPDDGTGKTGRWLRGPRAAPAPARETGDVRPLVVMDRGADVFDLSAERHRPGNVDIPVWGRRGRSLGPGRPKPFGAMRSGPVRARAKLEIPRASARGGGRWRTGRGPGGARGAGDAAASGEPEMWAAHLREETPPDGGGKPLEWMPLTTLPADPEAKALATVRLYRLRRRIGDWYGILRSGCRVEGRQGRMAGRPERAVTVSAAVAWRLAAMAPPGPETPEMPAGTPFPPCGVMALKDFAAGRGPPPPETCGDAITTMAVPGGDLNRRGDGPPGHDVTWRGYARPATMADTYERLLRLDRSSQPYRTMRPDGSCV